MKNQTCKKAGIVSDQIQSGKLVRISFSELVLELVWITN